MPAGFANHRSVQASPFSIIVEENVLGEESVGGVIAPLVEQVAEAVARNHEAMRCWSGHGCRKRTAVVKELKSLDSRKRHRRVRAVGERDDTSTPVREPPHVRAEPGKPTRVTNHVTETPVVDDRQSEAVPTSLEPPRPAS